MPPATDDRPDADRTRNLGWLLAALLIAGHLVAVVSVAFAVPFVSDEPGYVLAGRAIVQNGEWATPQERLHGPLPLVASQTFAADTDHKPTFESLDAERGWLRLGMLPFALLLMLATWRFAHDAWGERGGLLALSFAAVSPMLIGYGALVISDLAFAATAITTLWALWRWMHSPTLPRVVLFGAALGVCLATKYLAFILTLGILGAVGIAVLRGLNPGIGFQRGDAPGRPLWLRTAHALIQLVLAGGVALLVLYATYGFLMPPFDPARADELLSPLFQCIAGLPVVDWSLRILPEPMVVGADYQAYASSGLGGQFAGRNSGHWAYYLVAIATKATLPLLLAATVGAFFATSRNRVRLLGTALLVPVFALLFYLSVINKLQAGIRYVLLAYPVLALFAGALLRDGRRTRPGPWLLVIAGLMLWSFGVLATTWPQYLGYFNPTIGGPAGGHRLFCDSNCEWGQNFVAPREELRKRHPGVVFLAPSDGPRFGLVAAYTPDFGRTDPEDPARTYHWVTRFEPIDSWSAAWLVFDLQAADFESAFERGDVRASTDLILAWLREDDFDRAAATLERVEPSGRDDRIVELVESWRTARTAPAAADAARRRIVTLLNQLGRPDLALSWIGELDGVSQFEMFMAMWSAGAPREAVQWLQKRDADGSLSPQQAWLLAAGLAEFGEFENADDVLQRYSAPDEKDPWMPIYRKLRDTVAVKAEAMRALRAGDPKDGRH